MDKRFVDVEGSQRRNDSQPSASKLSLGSLVQMNSIAIDLNCAAEEIESPLHENFSIRDFVAGMKENDIKLCLPFASALTEVISTYEGSDVPPLAVPQFGWWQCPDCVPEITSESTALGKLADRSHATSSCQHVGGEKVIVKYSNIGEMEVCTLNRNPADFSIPEATNEYTITTSDLKSRKRKPWGLNLEDSKRGRWRKDAP